MPQSHNLSRLASHIERANAEAKSNGDVVSPEPGDVVSPEPAKTVEDGMKLDAKNATVTVNGNNPSIAESHGSPTKIDNSFLDRLRRSKHLRRYARTISKMGLIEKAVLAEPTTAVKFS